MASPFVSKLAGIAARLHSEHPFDIIFSFYLEPYGVAGYLAAQMTGLPHVVRMAGSDAGRLWRHPQLETLYDHVLRSAACVITGNVVAARAVERGVEADRIAFAGGTVVPEDIFTPVGPTLDLAALRTEVAADPDLRDLLWGEFTGDRPYFGVYGKLGDTKGSFALLAAMQRLEQAGLDVGLVALAHGPPAVEGRFRTQAREFGLADRILQLPFLPHWRVPEFIRGCLAVCCLEQDFPIAFRTPIVLHEVLLCGTCLVAATEVIRKLPGYAKLPHGYGCVAVEDVNDIDTLSKRLAAIVEDPAPAADVGLRGHEFARALQRNASILDELERILEAAAARRPISGAELRLADDTPHGTESQFRLTALAATAVAEMVRGRAVTRPVQSAFDLEAACEVLAAIECRMTDGERNLGSMAQAVGTEIAVASAELEIDQENPSQQLDPLFRLRTARWAATEGDLARLVCARSPQLRVLEFDIDVARLMNVRTVDDLAAPLSPGRSYLVVFGRSDGRRRSPLLVNGLIARILELSEGTRSVVEIAAELDDEFAEIEESVRVACIQHLFAHGLVSFQDRSLGPVADIVPVGAKHGDTCDREVSPI
jgi:glycosyltransferase involved in cell wall biosynthesis